MKSVVLLNDTSFENHHGCNIVIKNIKRNLEKRDIKLLATNPIGKDWKKNTNFLNKLKQADGVIINAEGTLHDNSSYGYSLLEIVNYTNKPCFLINMTYQNNSKKFSELVSKFTKVYVRETFSKNELAKYSIDSMVVPDMTFYKLENNIKIKQEKMIYITDSHDINKSKILYEFSENNNIVFLPIISPFDKYHNLKGFFKKIKYLFFSKYRYLLGKFFNFNYKYVRFYFTRKEDEFLEDIQNCDFLISARFHAICLSLHFQIPFLALSSNTFKIESLFSDIGLNKNRIIKEEDLHDVFKLKNNLIKFSSEELSNINDYIEDGNKKINLMFDEINWVIKENMK